MALASSLRRARRSSSTAATPAAAAPATAQTSALEFDILAGLGRQRGLALGGIGRLSQNGYGPVWSLFWAILR
eukprot:6844242-Lingulodinium_polyedra.AAC.3